MISNHIQSYITLGPADWVCVQSARRGWKVVRVQGVHVTLLTNAATRTEGEALAPAYAAVFEAELTGAA